MRAVKLANSHFDIPLRSHILVASDSTTVVAYIHKARGTRSWSLWKDTESLFLLVISHNLSIHAKYIPGNMNVVANDLSRAGQILPTEWSLHHDIAIFQQWGHPNLDLFATRQDPAGIQQNLCHLKGNTEILKHGTKRTKRQPFTDYVRKKT